MRSRRWLLTRRPPTHTVDPPSVRRAVITDAEPAEPMKAAGVFFVDYRRKLDPQTVGSNGVMHGLRYGRNRDGGEASGFANVTVVAGEVRGSTDPANEVGGCIGSLHLGVDGDEHPVTGTLWGSSYTLRGYPGVQPGGLMAYTAVVQNLYAGSGSRSPNYGYAAVTRPGIGDGADFWNKPGEGFRNRRTHPVDQGFIVCGDSGEYPEGGDVGYRVGFQAGGGASPWAQPIEAWRSKIGTGVVVKDWVEGGVRIDAPHPDAGEDAPFLACHDREAQMVAGIRSDGRVVAAPGRAASDVVTVGQLREPLVWHDLGSRDEGVARWCTALGWVHLEVDVVVDDPPIGFQLPAEARPLDRVRLPAVVERPVGLAPALLTVTGDGLLSAGGVGPGDTVVARGMWPIPER